MVLCQIPFCKFAQEKYVRSLLANLILSSVQWFATKKTSCLFSSALVYLQLGVDMSNFQVGLIGFGVGLVIALVVYIWQFASRKDKERIHLAEIASLKKMLTDRMELEGIQKLKAENEDLKKKNENLRITNTALMQKPGRQEVQRLHIYQKAVDRLTINAPGFGQAWQSALKESEEEFSEIYSGAIPFWKKVLPSKTNAKMIKEDETVDEE